MEDVTTVTTADTIQDITQLELYTFEQQASNSILIIISILIGVLLGFAFWNMLGGGK